MLLINLIKQLGHTHLDTGHSKLWGDGVFRIGGTFNVSQLRSRSWEATRIGLPPNKLDCSTSQDGLRTKEEY